MTQRTETLQKPNEPHPVRTVRVPAPPAAPAAPAPARPHPLAALLGTLRTAAPLWAWGAVVAGYAVLQFLLWGLGNARTFEVGLEGVLWSWQANLWADAIVLVGAAGLASGVVLLSAWARQGTGVRARAPLLAIPAIAVVGITLGAAAATLAFPGMAWFASDGRAAIPGNGLLDFAWDGFLFGEYWLEAGGILGAILPSLLLVGLVHVALRRGPAGAGTPEARAAAVADQHTQRVTVALAPKPPTKAAAAAAGHAKANGHSLHDVDPHRWIQKEGIGSTADVPLPELLIDEVIGQDEAVEVAKKAARQRRHLLLLGDPGTGKSMIAKAMAQILPPEHLDDVLLYANPKDQNMPRVRVLPGGQGRLEAHQAQQKARRAGLLFAVLEWTLSLGLVAGAVWAYFTVGDGTTGLLLMVMCIIAAIFFMFVARTLRGKPLRMVPNLLIERPDHPVPAPYVDATGSHHGALLGDVRHDPFQSGGLQTPTHLRVEPGAIHRAHKGLLFIDEINVLRLDSQQALLTAMQEKRYAITGQSERSSGAMARTEPVPCDFILVAAGNLDVIAPSDDRLTGLHPALRSRIRGYGYEVYVRSVMEDTDENRRKLVRFVAQEVRRDGRIPHFSGAAVAEVLREAQRRSGHSGKLTLRLRELGGLVRTAGDIARDAGADEVSVDHVLAAKRISMSLEYQVTRRGIEVATAKEALTVGGEKVGSAVGCAFMGTGETGEPAGIVVPVEADATVSSDRQKGSLFLGGGLEKDTGLADTVGAVLKRFRGAEMAGIDLHAQALLQQPGADVQALGAAAAIACLSALEGAAVRQDTVVLGAVAVSGRLRAVDGVTQMVEAAADLGYTQAVVPAANAHDILLEHHYKDRITVHLAGDLVEALGHALAVPPARRVAIQNALRRGVATTPPGKRTAAAK